MCGERQSILAPSRKPRLETSALIVGYAMSRLIRAYWETRGQESWKAAFADAAKHLNVAPASIKNLRDEFDPIHGDARRGWKGRPMWSNCQRVMGKLRDVSDAALLEMIDRIPRHDPDAMQEVVSSLSKPTERIFNVAQ